MGLFDPPKNHSEKTRDALTVSMKKNIKEAVGNKCEYCGIKKPQKLLEVHHISEVASANGNSDKNTPSNLIVLDLEHHKLADDGEITKTALKSKVSKRSEKVKTEIRRILRYRQKTTDSKKNLYGPPTFKPYKIPKIRF